MVCLNYTPWCPILHTLVCTKTHLGVLFNTPVLRVWKTVRIINNSNDLQLCECRSDPKYKMQAYLLSKVYIQS